MARGVQRAHPERADLQRAVRAERAHGVRRDAGDAFGVLLLDEHRSAGGGLDGNDGAGVVAVAVGDQDAGGTPPEAVAVASTRSGPEPGSTIRQAPSGAVTT